MPRATFFSRTPAALGLVLWCLGAGACRQEAPHPAFSFVGMSLVSLNLGFQTASFDLTFSGPVEAGSLKDYAAWEVDDMELSAVRYLGTKSRRVVRAELRPDNLRGGSVILLTVQSGVPQAGAPSVLAEGGEGKFTVDDPSQDQ